MTYAHPQPSSFPTSSVASSSSSASSESGSLSFSLESSYSSSPYHLTILLKALTLSLECPLTSCLNRPLFDWAVPQLTRSFAPLRYQDFFGTFALRSASFVSPTNLNEAFPSLGDPRFPQGARPCPSSRLPRVAQRHFPLRRDRLRFSRGSHRGPFDFRPSFSSTNRSNRRNNLSRLGRKPRSERDPIRSRSSVSDLPIRSSAFPC